MKIIILGSAHPLRGGLASYNERLAREFMNQGHEVDVYTFSLQYPEFLFPGTTQYSTEPASKDLRIHVKVNSVNPVNWYKVGKEIAALKPDMLIVKFWLPFMAPCLGKICRLVKANGVTKVLAILDNIVPHEKRFGDRILASYFVNSVDAFIAMSDSVLNDLSQFNQTKPRAISPHPLFDNFGEAVTKKEAYHHLGLAPNEEHLLFFGFIRDYKGLDLLLQAMADERVRRLNMKLIVAGEFYTDAKPYADLIRQLNLQDKLVLKTDFIPDSEVRYYFCAADMVVQPYKHATQSGVTQICYHFNRPMLVTNVGGLADTVPHLKVGVVTEPSSEDIANGIVQLYDLGAAHFMPYIQEERKKYTWEQMTEKFLALHQQL